MRSGFKSALRNFIIHLDPKNSTSCQSESSQSAGMRVIFDGMALFRIFQPRQTYEEWVLNIIRCIQGSFPNASQIEIITDVYSEQCYRLYMGSSWKQISACASGRIMFQQGNDWSSFFHNTKNKTNLNYLALDFFCSPIGRPALTYPLIFTCNHKVYKISRNEVITLQDCNYLEAETYHSSS